jgi:mRNA interferase RelE/StbE
LKVKYKRSFIRDLKRVKDVPVKNQVRETIELIEQAQNLRQIKNIRKLREGDRYYRIKIGDYRLGLILEDDSLTFVRFLHRKDLYRYFP